jgi:hypothetical protein
VVPTAGRSLLLLCVAANIAGFAQEIPGVTVALPPSADYFERVDEVAGSARPENLDAWLPYGIAITNHTSQNIVALVVRWSGPTVKHTVMPSMFGNVSRQIAPGKTAIVIPTAVLPSKRPVPMSRLGVFQNAASVQAMLDGVVFASGQFWGPNASKGYEAFVAETTVPAHVASTILAMRESGEAIGTVVAWLETNARGKGLTARTSRSLADSYKRRGEAVLYQLAESLAKGPGIKVYR